MSPRSSTRSLPRATCGFASNHDDRVGCIVLAQLLRELKGAPISHDLYAVFTTQEEVGLRGATTSAYAVDPEIGIALDVTLTGDLPYATPAMEVAMGKGVAIKVQDGGMISHAWLNKLLIVAAEGAGIPYQLEVLMGGTTDARSMQGTRAGVPATCLSIRAATSTRRRNSFDRAMWKAPSRC